MGVTDSVWRLVIRSSAYDFIKPEPSLQGPDRHRLYFRFYFSLATLSVHARVTGNLNIYIVFSGCDDPSHVYLPRFSRVCAASGPGVRILLLLSVYAFISRFHSG